MAPGGGLGVCRGWLTRSLLGNTEGYGNFSVALSSLAFSLSGDSGEGRWLCKGVSRMTSVCKQMLCILHLFSLVLILGEEKGKLMWLFSGSFSERYSPLPWNSEGSLTEAKGGGNSKRGVGHRCWYLPRGVN